MFLFGSFYFRFRFCLVSPEFSYRPGLGIVAEGSSSVSSPGATGSGGAPNRPLPPTPDDDDSQGDKTLVLRRVSVSIVAVFTFQNCLGELKIANRMMIYVCRFLIVDVFYVRFFNNNNSSPRPV